uniref:Vacuole membrane protein 1 n=1 Tax=Panagrolaimus sp. JU765 TaxID=591449 RepID=A0AC34Q566_9BILA
MGKNKKKAPKTGRANSPIKVTNNVHFTNQVNHVNHHKDYLPPSGRGMRTVPSEGALAYMERQKIVLWKQPITTLYYCILEVFYLLFETVRAILQYRKSVFLFGIFLSGFFYLYYTPGSHQVHIVPLEKQIRWCLYWIGLGILSSIGFGTGLHTFLIYLGPHIAQVTLAAYECNSLDFPNYPDEIECPQSLTAEMGAITIWSIINKVRIEALMWGAGTALGELPPYFVARGARLSGESPDDEDYKEFLALQQAEQKLGQGETNVSIYDRIKIYMEKIVKRTGFFGILLFASIPNPLFDFAGITCGHFLIPFWTFFGATLIGKAIMKAHLQMFIVIVVFSQHHVETILSYFERIPYIGPLSKTLLTDFFNKQKEKFHRRPGTHIEQQTAIFSHFITFIVSGMIILFLVSILNSLAQKYHKRCCDAKKGK